MRRNLNIIILPINPVTPVIETALMFAKNSATWESPVEYISHPIFLPFSSYDKSVGLLRSLLVLVDSTANVKFHGFHS